jgi:site-specific recombinase XerD
MEPRTKLLDHMRNVMRLKHMSLRTEEAYVSWVKRFILFHDKRHPGEMGADEIRAFLTHLAVQGNVAASTQNGALNALVFLYRQVLKQPFPELEGIERAKRPRRIPTVFTAEETQALLAQLSGTPHLMAGLLYGAGLRLMECVRLRVKDVDFAYQQITVRDGKGAQDRVTMLPQSLQESLQRHLVKFRDPSVGKWLRHSDRAGAAWPQGRSHHHDLHARAATGWKRGAKSSRSIGPETNWPCTLRGVQSF